MRRGPHSILTCIFMSMNFYFCIYMFCWARGRYDDGSVDSDYDYDDSAFTGLGLELLSGKLTYRYMYMYLLSIHLPVYLCIYLSIYLRVCACACVRACACFSF